MNAATSGATPMKLIRGFIVKNPATVTINDSTAAISSPFSAIMLTFSRFFAPMLLATEELTPMPRPIISDMMMKNIGKDAETAAIASGPSFPTKNVSTRVKRLCMNMATSIGAARMMMCFFTLPLERSFFGFMSDRNRRFLYKFLLLPQRLHRVQPCRLPCRGYPRNASQQERECERPQYEVGTC